MVRLHPRPPAKALLLTRGAFADDDYGGVELGRGLSFGGPTSEYRTLALGGNFLPKLGGTSVYINPFSACLFDRIKSPLTISSQRILGDAGEIVRNQRRGKIQTRWRSQLSIDGNRGKFGSERTGVRLKRSLILEVTIIYYVRGRDRGDRQRGA